MLSPVLVLSRVGAALFRRVGWVRWAEWLSRRRILLPTAVSRRVEILLAAELLDLAPAGVVDPGDPDTLARAVLEAPQLRAAFRDCASPDAAHGLAQRIAGAVGEYAGTRSAVAEITVTACVLVVGALVFQALTPGMISMAPGVADALARSTAIASFPLGETLGGAWYGIFGIGASPWLIGATVAASVMAGSVFAAFAGIVADPVQSLAGIHRRRLARLLDTLEADIAGRRDRPFTAREHIYARAFDLWDAAASAFRLFRN